MKNWGPLTSFIDFFRLGHLPSLSQLAESKTALWAASALLVVILYIVGIFLVVPNLFAIIWPWNAQSPAASYAGYFYLVNDISWLTAGKLIIFLAVLWLIFKGIHSEINR